jgi:hypothetical protein
MNASDENELEGLTELGSKKEALARAAEFLDRSDLSDKQFREAIRAILTYDFVTKRGKYRFNSARWAFHVERAYASMPASQQKRLRSTMLWFFSQWNEEKGAEFLDKRYSEPRGLAIALRVAVVTEHPASLTVLLARQAKVFLHSKLSDFEADDLHAALAYYCASCGNLEAALVHSKSIRHVDVFAECALKWPVEIQLVSALREARERLATIEEYRRLPPTQMDLALPEYRETELDKAAKSLMAYERTLLALVPGELIAKWTEEEPRQRVR